MTAPITNLFPSLPPLASLVQQLPLSGLNSIGLPSLVGSAPNNNLGNTGVQDLRVRLSALDTTVYSSSPIMQILTSTGGMMFPYTPSLSFNQTVDYMNLQLVHSNTDYPAYTRTPSVKISVQGKFTVQNQQEGQYALAVIHFLRTVSKSYFGEIDAASGKAGLPPPVLLLSGYGTYMFGLSGPSKGLRVILTGHNWNFDENIDTILITAPGGMVRLPALFTISCELTVVQTPSRMRNQFSFDAFAKGTLMQSNNGWI